MVTPSLLPEATRQISPLSRSTYRMSSGFEMFVPPDHSSVCDVTLGTLVHFGIFSLICLPLTLISVLFPAYTCSEA